MSDRARRQAQRDLLPEQVLWAARDLERSGLSRSEALRSLVTPAFTTARDMACPECAKRARASEYPMHYPPACCGGSGRVPWEPLDYLRALAFAGCGESREIVGEPWEWLPWVGSGDRRLPVPPGPRLVDTDPPDVWLRRLTRLAARLPLKRVEVPCSDPHCVDGRWPGSPPPEVDFACETCNGTGKLIRDASAERWLGVAVAVGLARECYADCDWPSVAWGGQVLRGGQVLSALEAAAAWVAEPTPERQEAWMRSESPSQPAWVPLSGFGCGDAFFASASSGAVEAAAKVLGPERAREVMRQAALAALRGET